MYVCVPVLITYVFETIEIFRYKKKYILNGCLGDNKWQNVIERIYILGVYMMNKKFKNNRKNIF